MADKPDEPGTDESFDPEKVKSLISQAEARLAQPSDPAVEIPWLKERVGDELDALKSSLPATLALLAREDLEVRRAAFHILWKYFHEPPEAVQPLLDIVASDQPAELRIDAIDELILYLAKHGREQGVPTLARIALDEAADLSLRRAAYNAAGRCLHDPWGLYIDPKAEVVTDAQWDLLRQRVAEREGRNPGPPVESDD